MQVELNYGKRGVTVKLPDTWDVTVVEKTMMPILPDPKSAVEAALADRSAPGLSLKKPGDGATPAS